MGREKFVSGVLLIESRQFSARILLLAEYIYISSDKPLGMGNHEIPACQLCQLRNTISKVFASNKVACMVELKMNIA